MMGGAPHYEHTEWGDDDEEEDLSSSSSSGIFGFHVSAWLGACLGKQSIVQGCFRQYSVGLTKEEKEEERQEKKTKRDIRRESAPCLAASGPFVFGHEGQGH